MSDGLRWSPVASARAEPGAELLRSPVTGQPCVYWRLRIVEHLTARSELVHEIASPEPFELAWGGRPSGRTDAPPVRIRLDPEAAASRGRRRCTAQGRRARWRWGGRSASPACSPCRR